MTTDKIYLGTIDNEKIYLSKHSWDCDWYWGLWYLGNKNLHFYIVRLIEYRYIKDSFLRFNKEVTNQNFCNIDTFFTEAWLTQKDWWILRNLFIQAYALKNAAEVYRHGGHQFSLPGVTDIIKSETMEKAINKDLEKVLDTIWNYLLTAKAGNQE